MIYGRRGACESLLHTRALQPLTLPEIVERASARVFQQQGKYFPGEENWRVNAPA